MNFTFSNQCTKWVIPSQQANIQQQIWQQEKMENEIGVMCESCVIRNPASGL